MYQTQQRILASEQTPMVVVEYQLWEALGHIPRSSEGVGRYVRANDSVIFVSHRWWDDQPEIMGNEAQKEHAVGADGQPYGHGHKYSIISRGIRKIIRANKLNPATVAVWCDFSCVDQDDPERRRQGTSSLFSYVARSAFVLAPVQVSSNRECIEVGWVGRGRLA